MTNDAGFCDLWTNFTNRVNGHGIAAANQLTDINAGVPAAIGAQNCVRAPAPVIAANTELISTFCHLSNLATAGAGQPPVAFINWVHAAGHEGEIWITVHGDGQANLCMGIVRVPVTDFARFLVRNGVVQLAENRTATAWLSWAVGYRNATGLRTIGLSMCMGAIDGPTRATGGWLWGVRRAARGSSIQRLQAELSRVGLGGIAVTGSPETTYVDAAGRLRADIGVPYHPGPVYWNCNLSGTGRVTLRPPAGFTGTNRLKAALAGGGYLYYPPGSAVATVNGEIRVTPPGVAATFFPAAGWGANIHHNYVSVPSGWSISGDGTMTAELAGLNPAVGNLFAAADLYVSYDVNQHFNVQTLS
jgi:hypothetical protein